MPDTTHSPAAPSTAGTGDTTLSPSPSWATDPAVDVQGSVFVTGQVCSREQRRGRYTPESMAHPGKMLPSIARYLIATYTRPGEWVLDPMAGIATTVVEAMHLGRRSEERRVGKECKSRWSQYHQKKTRHQPSL